MQEIKFNKTVEAFGRNGFTKNTGLWLSVYADLLAIYYTTSRGNLGRAMIEVPLEHVGDVIDALETILEEAAPDLFAKYLAGY